MQLYKNKFPFIERHESWKQRNEKKAKEREADEAEEEAEMSNAMAARSGGGGKLFKRAGPMRLGAEIKIKIAVRKILEIRNAN